MITIIIPLNDSTTDIIGPDGQSYQARADNDGRRVIDLPPSLFRALLAGPHGKKWEDANQENKIAWERMTPGVHLN